MTPDLIAVGEDRWELGDLVFDLARWEVLRGGEALPVTSSEFRLLDPMVRAHGRPIATRRLLEVLWDVADDMDDVGTRAVHMHIVRIRRKLGRGAIRTVRGMGYALDCAWAPDPSRDQMHALAESARGFLKALEAVH